MCAEEFSLRAAVERLSRRSGAWSQLAIFSTFNSWPVKEKTRLTLPKRPITMHLIPRPFSHERIRQKGGTAGGRAMLGADDGPATRGDFGERVAARLVDVRHVIPADGGPLRATLRVICVGSR